MEAGGCQVEKTNVRQITILALLALIFFGVAVGATLFGLGGSGSPIAQASGPEMSLGAIGNVACDQASKPAKCVATVDPVNPKASAFTITVNANVLPVGGYSGFGSEVFFGGLTYNPRATCTAEVVWPDEGAGICFPNIGPSGQRQHASGTAIVPPFPKSNFTGRLIE